ncbi:MAG: hypothetical protein M1458_03760 [Deltaproteobacteria bacterium]|nr:hypothetical protein [Deltaproteobacteria bacterium]
MPYAQTTAKNKKPIIIYLPDSSMPVLSMLRRDNPFKILYNRMVEREKVKKVAVIAVMKKVFINSPCIVY